MAFRPKMPYRPNIFGQICLFRPEMTFWPEIVFQPDMAIWQEIAFRPEMARIRIELISYI